MADRPPPADVPPRALAIGAHPDDAEFGCGATLAKWAAAGCEVSLAICTDGSKGTWDPGQDPAALVALRQDEQRAAATALGARGDVVFLGQVDGELESTMSVRAQVAFEIRRLRPTIVLGHDPWKRYRLHPDHRHAGLLAVEGVVAARDPLFFPDQGMAHHRPDELWLFEADEPDHIEDVSDHLDSKLGALRAHTSQLRSTMYADPGSPDFEENWTRFSERIRRQAGDAGRPAGYQAGESFKILDLS